MKTISKIVASAALLGAALMPLAAQADGPFYPGGGHVFQGARPGFGPGPREFGGRVRWSGSVDDTATVSIHRGDVRTETRSGKSVTNVDSQLFGFLPDRPVNVFLRGAEGRGHVRIVQQPSPENDWTAVVRIHDPQPGRSYYAFDLGWEPRPF